jgi:putative transposase
MVIRKRLPIEGKALVFVTATVTDWIPVFDNSTAAEIAIDRLSEATKHFSVAVVGYVLMPSHLHLLLGFSQIRQLSKFMQSFKILSSKAVKQSVNSGITDGLWNDGKFNLWKPRFDDLIIVSAEQFRTKLNYIHTNPVRAGLVSDPAEWLNSSASDWLTDRKGPLRVDKNFRWME